MEVFAVTVFVSLAFAVLFAALFFAERSQRQRRSIDQDALLPLDEGSPGRSAESMDPVPVIVRPSTLRP
jgi:hypothetical protein